MAKPGSRGHLSWRLRPTARALFIGARRPPLCVGHVVVMLSVLCLGVVEFGFTTAMELALISGLFVALLIFWASRSRAAWGKQTALDAVNIRSHVGREAMPF